MLNEPTSSAASKTQLYDAIIRIRKEEQERIAFVKSDAQRKMDEILSVIIDATVDRKMGLIAATPAPTVKAASPPSPPRPPVIPPVAAPAAPSGRGGVQKLTDQDLIDVLTTRPQTPPQIVAKLAAKGIKMSKPSIYNRMPKLVEKMPDLIKVQPSPLAWAIKSKTLAPTTVPTTAKRTSVTAPTKPRKTARKPATKPKSKGFNPAAKLRKLVESALTNQYKAVEEIRDDVAGHNWNATLADVRRALNDLVAANLADEIVIDGEAHYTRA